MKIKKSLLLLFSALFVTSCSCGDPAPEKPGGDEQNPGTVEPEPTPGGDTTEDPVDEPAWEKLNRIPYSVMEKLAKGTTKTANHVADVEDIVQVDFGARQVGVRNGKGHVASDIQWLYVYTVF